MVHATLPVHKPNADDVVIIFDRCFNREFNTQLLGGAEEPLYLPAVEIHERHRIFFTRDYVASALHEVAHWCLAGDARRKRVDYGYWYAPDGRSAEQQAEFERVEIKPQAIEWHLAESCGLRFRVSADNLNAALGPSGDFVAAVAEQARYYCLHGLPPRAATFAQALAGHFGLSYPPGLERFVRERLL